jgi:cytoskeletal protein RodZ
VENLSQPAEAVDDGVSSPGAILRRCREFNNISLADAAEVTKIGKNYLLALESDRSQEFASQAYRKGFMRIYANYLGLNADDMVHMLERDPQTPSTGLYSMKAQIELPKTQLWKKLFVPAILLAAVLATSLLFTQKNSGKPKPVTSEPATAIVTQPTAQQAVSSSKTATIPLTPAVANTAPPAPAPDGVSLKMKVNQNGTLVVTIDGANSQSYELNAGDLIEWKAEKTISLDLSNPAGLELELHGKPLPPLGPPGKPAFVIIEPTGIKR